MIDKRFPHAYTAVLAELARRLREPAPGRIQLLTGPRQVGKTHLLRELERKHAGRVVYAAADAPASALSGWWEAQWSEAEAIARRRGKTVLMLDEIQYVPDWGRRLKAAYDRVTHAKVALHVVVSGSSSLHLGQGTRESMAGRFEVLRLLHWPPHALALHFGMSDKRAADVAVRLGTYPGAVPLLNHPERFRAYVRDAIVEPAIGRDIMALEVIRKPALLRQVFAVAVGHAAEIVSLQKLQGQLAEPGAVETIAHYLHVLEQTYLVAAIPKFSAREIRQRAAPPKLVVLNQGILACLTNMVASAGVSEAARFGRWVENACLALAWNAGQSVWYWRQEPLEVDMVLAGSWGKWAVEVKTGPYGVRDLGGLLRFSQLHPAFRPLVVCSPGHEQPARTEGVQACTWQEFLLLGPPRR